ncbi:unnamed protein product [Symbiodinium sp. CCMP2592]|nr:unnamed protein product [Symbiodinium sp. CCMP2592]
MVKQMQLMKAVILQQQQALNVRKAAEVPATEAPEPSPAKSTPGKAPPSSKPEAEPAVAPRGQKRSRSPQEGDSTEDEFPRVLISSTLDRNEKNKVRRICTPKPGTGNLEVPENIFEMFQDAAKGRETLYKMWAKSGGVKVGTVLTNKRNTTRIEKIVKWAESKGLVRECEYDPDVLEYWVNIRTEGELSKEDMESLTHTKQYEGEGGDELCFKPRVRIDGFDLADDDDLARCGAGNKEGDHQKPVSAVLTEHLGYTLKAKNSLTSFLDKMRSAGAGDTNCAGPISKLEGLQKEFEAVYEEMADAQAEGKINGFSEKLAAECHTMFKKATKLQTLNKMRKAAKKKTEEEKCCANFEGSVLVSLLRYLAVAVVSRILLDRELQCLRLSVKSGSEDDNYISEQVYDIVKKYGKGESADQTPRQSPNPAVTGLPCAATKSRKDPSEEDLDMRVIGEASAAGKILRRCIDVVRKVRYENGGEQLCVFKIGLTANPVRRRASYRDQNFRNFVIIHQTCRSDLLGLMEMLEAAIIAEFYDAGCRCRNRQLGGESMRDRDQRPRFAPPYYAYCAATNASQREPILGSAKLVHCFKHGVPAKDLVLDARTAAKTDSCHVLAKIASVKESSADAPLFKILRQYGLALPAPISVKKVATLENYPYLDPASLLEALSGNGYFHKVLGVPVHSAESCLLSFWEKFRELHPNHGIFSQYISLGNLIPYYLHGDGGRGYKKDPIEILSMFPALGAGSRSNPVDLSGKRKSDDLTLGINLRGNSGTTRFLFAVLSSLVYKRHPDAFDALLDLWGQKLQNLLSDGFQAMGTTWYVAIIGFTGDSPFVKKVGNMNRSFHNVRKRASSKNANQTGCCWLCMAGTETATENYPFEHVGFFEPGWIQTQRHNNQVPWEDNGGPLLPYMQVDADDTPSAWFKADLFHVFHAGVGQDFTASAITYSMRLLFNRGGFERDLVALNEHLATFMKSQRKRLHCGFLTKDLLGYNSTREFPEGKWSKNSDTAVVMQFLVFFLQQEEFAARVRSDPILNEILEAALAMGRVIRKCFRADFFMASDDCVEIIQNGHAFLCGYSNLCGMCYRNELCLFKNRPKLHYLNHIFLRIYNEWTLAGTATNPVAEATFMSEDFVGHTARISRRVDPRSIAIKVLQRYLCWIQTVLDKDTLLNLDLSWLD